ncbi:SDR family oxidoreductase [Acinetobacter calcoaceticus]|uniref:SDR family oxidoreductase n=1 Tax=Acinetobacter calcoaceticus TaxID=471 RepID=UPI0032B43031
MLNNRIAIITGASSGIGRAISELFLSKGFSVVGNARDKQRLSDLEQCSKSMPGTFIPIVGDITEEGVVEKLLGACYDNFASPPSIGIVNAGRGLPGNFIDSDSDKWKQMIDLNVLGTFYQLRMLASAMTTNQQNNHDKNPRDIVVLGSTIGTNVSPSNPVYGATKFAVHGATESLRRDLGPLGVRVTLIQPGFVRTNFQEASGYDLEAFAQMTQKIGDLVEANDVARTVEFVIDQPAHVHLHDIMLRSTRQSYP